MSVLGGTAIFPELYKVYFECSERWTPEGLMRITFIRAVDPRVDTEKSGKSAQSKDYYVKLNARFITKLPLWGRTKEKLFGVAAVDDTGVSVYDSPCPADVIDSGFLRSPLAEATNKRLLTSWIKPYNDTELFMKVEFKETGSKIWEEWQTCKLQGEISGSDNRIYHTDANNPYLHDALNLEKDVERFWDLKFIHNAMAGVGKVPVKPALGTDTLDDGTNFYFPFYCKTHGGSYNNKFPWRGMTAATGAPKVVQQVANVTYTDTSNAVRHALWARHIELGELCRIIFDYTYGANNWIHECEDAPFRLRGGLLNSAFTGLDAPYYTDARTINCGPNAPIQQWVLIPLSLWGYWQMKRSDGGTGLEDIIGNTIPRPGSPYTSRFESAFEALLDMCYSFGWLPVFDQDVDTGKVRISFKLRDTNGERFTTIVPSESKPTAYFESEAGLKSTLLPTVKNALTALGDYDDWFSTRQSVVESDTAVYRQPRGYVVPESAAKPATLELSMCFGEESSRRQKVFMNDGSSVSILGWYMTSYPGFDATKAANSLFTSVGGTLNPIDPVNTEDFPMFAPLVYAGVGTVDANVTGTQIPALFAPVVSGEFDYVDEDGNSYVVHCQSLRQLTARYYSLFFVKSDVKYTRSYPTVTQFRNSEGKTGRRYLDLLNVTQLPDVGPEQANADYGVHAIKIDCESWKTDVEYLRTVTLRRIVDKKSDGTLDWHDDTEQSGDETPQERGGTNVPQKFFNTDTTATAQDTHLAGDTTASPTLTLGDPLVEVGNIKIVQNLGPNPLPVVIPGGSKTVPALLAYSFIAAADGYWYSITNDPGLTTVDLAADVTGTLGIGSGGSGANTANDALNAFLPSQTSNSGKGLLTNGTDTHWGDVGTITSVGISGGTTGLSFGSTVTSGAASFTATGALGIGNGGTNASTASGARTNLGLGSIATQSASSVAITGGTITGVAFGSRQAFTAAGAVTAGTTEATADMTIGSYTLTLPAANSTAGAGQPIVFLIIKAGGTLSVAPTGTDTLYAGGIVGSTSLTTGRGSKAYFISDGTSTWYLV